MLVASAWLAPDPIKKKDAWDMPQAKLSLITFWPHGPTADLFKCLSRVRLVAMVRAENGRVDVDRLLGGSSSLGNPVQRDEDVALRNQVTRAIRVLGFQPISRVIEQRVGSGELTLRFVHALGISG